MDGTIHQTHGNIVLTVSALEGFQCTLYQAECMSIIPEYETIDHKTER